MTYTKDELVEWENIPIPDFYLPILNKPKITKSRAVKKVKLSPLKSKSLVKAQSKVSKITCTCVTSKNFLI